MSRQKRRSTASSTKWVPANGTLFLFRRLLEQVLPKNSGFRDFEVTCEFPHIGRKTVTLNAKKLLRREDQEDLILLAIEDTTALQDGRERDAVLLQEKQVLVQEAHHRQLVAAAVVYLTANAETLNQPHVMSKPLSRATLSSVIATALAARQSGSSS